MDRKPIKVDWSNLRHDEELVRQWRHEMRGSGAGMVPFSGLRQELETPGAPDQIIKDKLL